MVVLSVADIRTWRPLADGRDAPYEIEVDATARVETFAMDFSKVLNDGEKIASADAGSVVSGTTLPVGTLALANDCVTVHVPITLTTTAGERKVRVTVTASGGDVHVAEGFLNLV